MSHHINYQNLGWEQFEDLCINLWFDEGYGGITPYGRQREGGRDAVFHFPGSIRPLIFQFKRWTGTYSAAETLARIKTAAEKVRGFSPQLFIINSPLPPNAKVLDGIPQISAEVGFEVGYYDRSWLDLRLDNRRQDLRQQFFGPDIAHLTLESLLARSNTQLTRAMSAIGGGYNPSLYVERQAEGLIAQFTGSDKTVLAIVDRSGCGKTNLICHLAESLVNSGKPAVLIRADLSSDDDHSLERELSISLGFAPGSLTSASEELSRVASESGVPVFLLIDGLSEAVTLPAVARALANLVAALETWSSVKTIFTCRDTAWRVVEYRIPKGSLFSSRPLTGNDAQDKGAFAVEVGDYSDSELDIALERYSRAYDVDFRPGRMARNSLRHPLHLRLFCEINRGRTLGDIATVATAEMYRRYLSEKCDAISVRLSAEVTSQEVLSGLVALAGMVWESGLADGVEVRTAVEGLASDVGPERARRVVDLLKQEGILAVRKGWTQRRDVLAFIFEELRDVLLLEHLLPVSVGDRAPLSVPEDVIARVADHVTRLEVNGPTVKLAELMGMVLDSPQGRQDFLRAVMGWDLHAFCLCLARIPPSGWLADCDATSIHQMSTYLAEWYERILAGNFPRARECIDPWFPARSTPAQSPSVGITMEASPGCRELMYRYRCHGEGERQVQCEAVDRYPLMKLSLSDGKREIQLHDPDHGIGLSILRSSGFGVETFRIWNTSVARPFPGASLEVPERLALNDVWVELSNMLGENSLPSEPTYLVEERARALAMGLPGLSKVEGLTREDLDRERANLLVGLPSPSRQRVQVETSIQKLAQHLTRLGGPIPESDLPGADMDVAPGVSSPGSGYSEAGLRNYLGTVLANAIVCYRGAIQVSFPEISTLLNLNRQYPFRTLVITDGRVVRYAVMPEEDEEKAYVHFAVPTGGGAELDNPTLKLDVDGVGFDEYVHKSLGALGRHHPVVAPVHRMLTVEQFFTPTPVNDIVLLWLTADLRRLMGL
jgi:hypothetical protein